MLSWYSYMIYLMEYMWIISPLLICCIVWYLSAWNILKRKNRLVHVLILKPATPKFLLCVQLPVGSSNGSGIILCVHPANVRQCYSVTPPLIGWAHTQNNLWWLLSKWRTIYYLNQWWLHAMMPKDVTRPQWVKSFWPSDAIWWQRSGPTLAQVMAWCLMAPSHYLNQCWLIISVLLWHSHEGNLQEIIKISILDMSFKNY